MKRHRLILMAALVAAVIVFGFGKPTQAAGNVSGYAWSSNVGWVHMSGSNYGVNVAADGSMSGYAWSSGVGWISFNSGDVSGCPSGSCAPHFDNTTGQLTGWARVLSYNGWLHLAGSGYGVSANGCSWDGYAWGGGADTNTGIVGWLHFRGANYGVTGTGPACTLPMPNPDLKINGSDGPLSVAPGANLNITWAAVSNANTCTGSGTGWSGAKSIAGGNDNISATATADYILSCTGNNGTRSDTVQVTVAPSLKICESSCSSGTQRGNFTMANGTTRDLVACWNTAIGCSSASGNVTTSATWAESGGNAISLSGTSPKTVHADNVGNETVSATYNSQTRNANITVACVATNTCSSAAQGDNYCANESYTIDDGCGNTLTCTGRRACDLNWKEIAP